MKHYVKIILSEKEIANRITELGQSISEYYSNSNCNLILVGLLKGAFMFVADLCRVVTVEHKVDFITTSSYNDRSRSNHNVRILKDLDEDIYGKDVLIVEDIIDSGNTLNHIRKKLTLRHPRSLSICTLLDKPDFRKVKVTVKWVGFTIPYEFVVGYGIDYAHCYRHLPYVGKVVKTI